MESAALTQKIKADVAKLDSITENLMKTCENVELNEADLENIRIGCFLCREVIAGIENTRARLKGWSRG